MKINWSVRLRNRAWLTTLAATVAAFVFDMLNLLGIAPGIGEDVIMGLLSALLTLLAAVGVVMDPTTPGMKDSSDVLDKP